MGGGADGLPTAYVLHQNYPNPFNPSTLIRYDLPEASAVRLNVYDVIGREIAVLVADERQPAGRHSVRFDASRLATGIYFYRLIAGTFTDIKKLVLVR